MADQSITAANVAASANAVKATAIAGEALTAGQVVYKRASDGKVLLADTDSVIAEVRQVYGIALNGAGANQPVQVVTEDPSFTPGFTVTVGSTYVLSGTAGAIAAHADLTSGDFPTILMVGLTASTVVFRPLGVGGEIPA